MGRFLLSLIQAKLAKVFTSGFSQLVRIFGDFTKYAHPTPNKLSHHIRPFATTFASSQITTCSCTTKYQLLEMLVNYPILSDVLKRPTNHPILPGLEYWEITPFCLTFSLVRQITPFCQDLNVGKTPHSV